MRFSYAITALIAFIVLSFSIILAMFALKPAISDARQFIVPIGTSRDGIDARLLDGGYVRHYYILDKIRAMRNVDEIVPGGYFIPKNTNAWKLFSILSSPPAMVWITIPEGLRKEEVANILAEKLGWGDEEKNSFLQTPKSLGYSVDDGIYFPDTYLVEKTDGGERVAKRMINRFNELFAPYQEKFLQNNIKWDTALKIASLVQREAGGVSDTPIISAVIWNRLELGMKLDIDATLQYAVGNENNYWPRVMRKDKDVDSPYNTYRVRGLPPGPIANPGITAIDAVLNPAGTKCLYYIHDTSGAIYCSETYEEHQKNIAKYLR